MPRWVAGSGSADQTTAKVYDSITGEYVDAPLRLYVGPIDPEDTGVAPGDVDAWVDTDAEDAVGGLGSLTHSGYWTSVPHSSRGTLAMTADRLLLSPVLLTRGRTLTNFAVDVTVAAAGSTIDVVLYTTHPSDFAPQTLVRATTGLSGATVAVVQSAAFSEPLEPGVYWIGAVARGGAPTVRSIAVGGTTNIVPQETPGGTTISNALRYNTGGSVAPSTFPAVDNNNVLWSAAPPLVWFKVA